MSTTFDLIKKTVNEQELVLDITEQSTKFSIALGGHLETLEYGGEVEIAGLTADEVIGAALKMLNVVLYSYPEQWPIIVDKLRQLKY